MDVLSVLREKHLLGTGIANPCEEQRPQTQAKTGPRRAALAPLSSQKPGVRSRSLTNVLPTGSTGTSQPRVFASSSRDPREGKMLTPKDKFLEGIGNNTHDC